MILSRAILSVFCGGAVFLGAVSSAAAASARDRGSVAGPFYNAETNSYFQLFQHTRRGASFRWAQAHAQAKHKSHKGEHGHLALIKDPKTLEFIREKFPHPGDTWIGLRYFCKFSKLMWVDGELQGPKAAGMWHPQWHRTTARCEGKTYMPIYLTTPAEGGVYWQASGPMKGLNYYLVEYPGPKKPEDVSQNMKGSTKPGAASTTQ